ncbi:MAG: hypothetical protein EOO02_20205 [Chitinophagaceae bacterium]|nr:MAG: hypothetical protein EOO02_20205 [Chitinophagaceae bacterium]
MVTRCGCEMIYVSSAAMKKGVKLASPAVKVKSGQELYAVAYEANAQDSRANAPASVKQQFQSVDTMLSELETNMLGANIITHKFSNLSRYFLREHTLQKMLGDTDTSFLWIK